jgi:acetyltransferase-like isoleucine patch superfamily enzyme
VNTGKNVQLGPGTVFEAGPQATVQLGNSVWIGNDCEISTTERIYIGDRTSLQHRTQLHGHVTIGAGCVCAANLYISSGEHSFRDVPHMHIRLQDFHRVRLLSGNKERPVLIGDDCWLGINVVIMPGVKIGRGCVIGANSVVTRSLPPYTVAAGIPARAIGQRLRFDPPAELDSHNDIHIPYFYYGFRQLGDSEEQDYQPLRIRGGWVARNNFSLALAVTQSQIIQLYFDSRVSCCVKHGEVERYIVPGSNLVQFPAVINSDGLLLFQHTAVSPSDALVLIRACKLDAHDH